MFKLSNKKIYKKLGYSLDQEGILTRFLREGEGWKSHLENSKKWILQSQDETYETITILGSGWLLDVPLEELILKYSKIYLIDIVHPKQLVHKYRKQQQIEFIETDITGGLAKEVYNLIYKEKNSTFDINKITFSEPNLPKTDLVVSLNIINQLDILLVDALTEKISIPKNEILEFRKKIQQAHINYISKQKYCLISDWTQQNKDSKSKTEAAKPLVHVCPPAFTEQTEWKWEFDSKGLYEENTEVSFIVKAFRN